MSENKGNELSGPRHAAIERKKETIEVWNVCECGHILHSMHEGKTGQCASCWMKTMPSDTKTALNKLISAAFRKEKPTDSEKDALIDDAMAKLDRDEKATDGTKGRP